MMEEQNIEWIQTVKEQEFEGLITGYLVNGSMSVPKSEENRHYRDLILWLESNEPEPMYTAEEIAQQEKDAKIQEAKQYLASTDFKMTADYDQDTTEVRVLRQQARELIRSFE